MVVTARPIGALFSPRSVAVVGASDDPAKWGGLLARKALRGTHRRDVHLVNRRGGSVLGLPAHVSLSELPESPELVVACVPAGAFETVVDEALGAGAKAIVGICSGLERQVEAAVAGRVRTAGAVLLGPNCLGVFDRDTELDLAPWVDLPPGEIGLISQSGNLALELGLLAAREGVGFSRFASIGNQADLTAADLLDDFARHDSTRVIALYVEDFRDGREFARAARRAGKPVVLLAVGRSPAAARAARSHTGALVTDAAVVDAACRAAGIVRVSTPRELVDAAKALVSGAVAARGRRIAVVGDGGGHGAIAADVAHREGLAVPALSVGLAAELAALLPDIAETQNPVDLAGGAERDLGTFVRVGAALARSNEVDALLLTGYFGGYGGEQDVAATLAEDARAAGVPLVVHTLYAGSEAASVLREHGALVDAEIETAVRGVVALSTSAVGDVPELPDGDLAPVGDDYFSVRALVESSGVALAAAREVRSAEGAHAAANELGYPVVVKAIGRTHKSDGGGVVLGVRNAEALEETIRDLEGRLAPASFAVEREAARGDGVELIVGVRRDPRFGPVLLVGLGGVHAEVLADVAVGLAPVEAPAAEALIRSLRCSALFDGARGRPPLDVAAAADAAAALSRLAARAPWIAELELNPLLVLPDGALALDARLVAA